jgi:hypothetical protein
MPAPLESGGPAAIPATPCRSLRDRAPRLGQMLAVIFASASRQRIRAARSSRAEPCSNEQFRTSAPRGAAGLCWLNAGGCTLPRIHGDALVGLDETGQRDAPRLACARCCRARTTPCCGATPRSTRPEALPRSDAAETHDAAEHATPATLPRKVPCTSTSRRTPAGLARRMPTSTSHGSFKTRRQHESRATGKALGAAAQHRQPRRLVSSAQSRCLSFARQHRPNSKFHTPMPGRANSARCTACPGPGLSHRHTLAHAALQLAAPNTARSAGCRAR